MTEDVSEKLTFELCMCRKLCWGYREGVWAECSDHKEHSRQRDQHVERPQGRNNHLGVFRKRRPGWLQPARFGLFLG